MKRIFCVFVLSLCALAFSNGTAHAFCMEPRAGYGLSAPQPPGSYEKPSAPDCLSGYGSSVLKCDDRELRDYRDKAKRYGEKLGKYAADAKEFAAKAADFAGEAADYAACAQDELDGR